MPVENATRITELNPAWPLGTDPKSEGDNHIRMIKSVLVAPTGGAISTLRVLTITGTAAYTKPAFLKYLGVWVIGAGGGTVNAGAAPAANNNVSSSGGGGGAVYKLYANADLAASETMTIGGGSAGVAGGTSSFKGLTASGGGPGSQSGGGNIPLYVPGGVGGAATGGDINITGGTADHAVRCADNNGIVGYIGQPGVSYFTMPMGDLYAGSVANGVSGRTPGGGARGPNSSNGAGAGVGAAGGNGAIILVEYY